MLIKRLILQNFLSYNEADQDFESLHKVLIIGAGNDGDLSNSNGVGKSNFVNAIGWAVWGESKAKTLDENVKYDKDTCSVRVDFEHEGKDCSITRTRNKNQKTSTIDFTIDGVPSNGNSVTDTSKKIVEFLKIDYRTYVNSVFLRQNDIYSLANPEKTNESRAIIERVLNLDEYDRYEKLCKLEIKEIEKEIQKLSIFIEANGNIDDKIKEINKSKENNNNLKSVFEKDIEEASKNLKAIEDSYNAKKEELSKIKMLQDNLIKIKHDISSKNIELESKMTEGKREYGEREQKKKDLLGKISEKTSIEEQCTKYLNEYDKNYQLKIEVDNLTISLKSETEKYNQAQNKYSKSGQELYAMKSDASKLKTSLFEAEKNLNTTEVKEGEKCPTCFGDVTSHNIDDLRKHKQKGRDKIYNELKELNDTHDKKIKEHDEDLKASNQIASTIELIQSNIDKIKGQIILDKHHQSTLEMYAAKLSQITRCESDLNALMESKLIFHLKDRCSKLKEEIENDEKSKIDLESKLSGITLESITDIENKKNEAKAKVDSLNKNLYTVLANIKNDESKLQELNLLYNQYKETSESLKKNRDNLTLLEQLSYAFSSKGIRSKILEDAISELERESDFLLRRISDNKLSLKFKTSKEVEDGEKVIFEVRISKEGKELPFHLVSGGEQLRIAFVIRIALSKILLKRANSKIEFLIIDEAVSPLDKSGVENIMEMINELQNDFKTILVITHRDDVKNMFDQVITVVGDEEGSRIQI